MLERSPEEHRKRVSPTHSRTTATLLAAGHQNTTGESGQGGTQRLPVLHYQTPWRGGGRRTLKFHFPPAEGKGLGLLFSLSLSFSFAPLLSFSFHPHACAEDGSVCVCFVRVCMCCVSEQNAYKERARGSSVAWREIVLERSHLAAQVKTFCTCRVKDDYINHERCLPATS